MKKTIAILLAMMMVFSFCLVSCKGTDSDDDKGDGIEDTTPDNGTEKPDDPKPGDDTSGGDKDDEGGLVVGEDDDDGKWGAFIPYE